jgi:D-alanyl-D-alanine carboxypeptidase/D-alanyl-D-alanine-endopeptidase (penicillin-binding protein 4)
VSALALVAVLLAATPLLDSAAPDPVPGLRHRVARILESGSFAEADWGILAVSLDTGDTLVARNADVPLAPASNLKLLVTGAALHHLGPDFRWETLLVSDAPLTDGVLEGDLTLYGTGDPGLAARLHGDHDAPFDSLAARLRRAGVERVRGRVLGDGTFFVGPTRLPEWDPRDLNDWFTAASPALAYAENVVRFRVAADPIGARPRVGMDPGHGGVEIRNEARMAAGRARAPLWLVREDPVAPIRVTGELSRSARDVYRTMTVQDPLRTAAHAMTAALMRAGIRVDEAPATVSDPSRSVLTAALVHTAGADREVRRVRTLARFRSAPLQEALSVVNRRSHNLYADMVLKTLGRVVVGDGSFAGGGAVVERFAAAELGMPEGSVRVLDGSGLAEDNRVTAGGLVQLLAWVRGGRHGDAFAATLPEAGSRELNRRMVRTAAAGNLRAKTGTIQGVSALSGIVTSRDGERIAFSIVGNGLRSPYAAKRRVEDAMGVALAELRGRRLPLSAARAQQDQ